MATKQKLLEIRRSAKNKKPQFARQSAHKVNELKNSGWRKPKGKHSKIRKQRRSRALMPEPGFGSPSEVKGLLRDGLRPVSVCNVNTLLSLDAKEDGVIISSSVGMRKKIEIIKKALEMKLKVVNLKDAEKYMQEYLENRKELKKAKSARESDRKKKAEERAKKEEKKEKESIDQKVEKSEDEKKSEEKKQKDEILTQKT